MLFPRFHLTNGIWNGVQYVSYNHAAHDFPETGGLNRDGIWSKHNQSMKHATRYMSVLWNFVIPNVLYNGLQSALGLHET